MENCLGDLRDTVRVPYLDDIIVFSATFEEHIKHMRKVLGLLRDHGVKLKSQKCINCYREKLCSLGVWFPEGVASWTRPVSSQFLPLRILFQRQ